MFSRVHGRPSGAVDPFEQFLKEQSKWPAQWSSNRPLKKPKTADKKEADGGLEEAVGRKEC